MSYPQQQRNSLQCQARPKAYGQPGAEVCRGKKYNHHANHGTVPNDKANILGRDFEAETIHQKWCTDITYIHVLKEGWTYLACVMDLYSRKIIGYAYGLSMTAELAVEAVKMPV